MSEYSQEQLDAAVAAAVAPLKEQIAAFEVKASTSELETQIAEAKAEADRQVAELQAKLDSAVLEASEAAKANQDLVAYLESVKSEQEAAAELASRKEERLATVRDAASFPDDYIEANAERWAALDDAAFEALVSDWRAIAKKEDKPEGGSSAAEAEALFASTAMHASRNDDQASKPAYKEVFSFLGQGADLRNL